MRFVPQMKILTVVDRSFDHVELEHRNVGKTVEGLRRRWVPD